MRRSGVRLLYPAPAHAPRSPIPSRAALAAERLPKKRQRRDPLPSNSPQTGRRPAPLTTSGREALGRRAKKMGSMGEEARCPKFPNRGRRPETVTRRRSVNLPQSRTFYDLTKSKGCATALSEDEDADVTLLIHCFYIGQALSTVRAEATMDEPKSEATSVLRYTRPLRDAAGVPERIGNAAPLRLP